MTAWPSQEELIAVIAIWSLACAIVGGACCLVCYRDLRKRGAATTGELQV